MTARISKRNSILEDVDDEDLNVPQPDHPQKSKTAISKIFGRFFRVSKSKHDPTVEPPKRRRAVSSFMAEAVNFRKDQYFDVGTKKSKIFRNI
jgi:hypothetical protein